MREPLLKEQSPGELSLSSHTGILGCQLKDCRAGRSLALCALSACPMGVRQAHDSSLQGNPAGILMQFMVAMTYSCNGNS